MLHVTRIMSAGLCYVHVHKHLHVHKFMILIETYC